MPASITALAARGASPPPLISRAAIRRSSRATEAQGHLRRFAEFAEAMDLSRHRTGHPAHTSARPMLHQIETMQPWLGALGLLREEGGA